MKLFLVRHCQSEANAKKIHQGQRIDTSLSKFGKKQAKRLAKRLSSEKIDLIYSSDSKRTRETAEEINKFHNLEIKFDKRLREFDAGDLVNLEGFLEYKQIESKKLGIKTFEVCAPNGESERDHIQRVKSFVNELPKNKNILIVAHGGTNKIFFGIIEHVPQQDAYNIKQGNGCINEVDFDGKNWVVNRINSIEHIFGKDVINIVKELPEWFTKEAIKEIKKDLGRYNLVVKNLDDKCLGFIIYYFENNKCFIKWMAVKKDCQNQGTGKKLIEKLEKICQKNKIEFIETDTLAGTEDYPPYEKTRKFYHAVGFEDVEVIKKGYPEGSDKLILRKNLTRSNLPFRKNCEGYLILGDSLVARNTEYGYIDFPGGGVEGDEDIREALKRELLEEAGVIIDGKLKEVANIKTVWPSDWAKNEKQRKRFEKYQGDDMHFFVGKVKELIEPKGDTEENGWDVNERLMPISKAIEIIEGHRPFPPALKDYYELKLKILNEIKRSL